MGPAAVSEDAQLVARICGGDLDAFGILYDKYKGPLYRTALAISRDHAAAQEILQDAFVRAYAALGRAEVTSSLGPWLQRITVNVACNWARQNRRWSLALDSWLDRLASSSSQSPERAAEVVDLRQAVHEALAKLSFQQRAVIALYYLQGFSLNEIAYVLDCPVGTIKSRLHYAGRALRSRLQEDQRLAGEVVYGTP